MLGAGFLGFAAGLARSSAADRELIGDIEEELIKQRQQDLLEIQNRWHRDGVSPTEQTYRALVRPPRPMNGETATGEPLVLDETDRRLGKMIQERCDRVWEGIDVRRYVMRKDGQVAGLDGGAILAEIREIVRDVARLYSADTDNPVMEARIGDIALAARSVVSELLQAAQQVPFVDPTRLTIRQIVNGLERVQKARNLYRKLTPYQHYVSGVTIAARFALGANPVSLVAWYLGGEAAKAAGKRVLATYSEVWLKELLEGAVALVYLRVAGAYDPRRIYLSADWIALVEALRVHKHIPGVDHNRKLLLERILHAQIPDEFAKMTLLRALAEDRDPNSGMLPIDFTSLHPAQRQAIAERLAAILPSMRGLNEPEASKAIDDLGSRLQWGLQVDLIGAGSRPEVRAEEGLVQLATLARDWCRLSREKARVAMSESAFAQAARKSTGKADGDALLEKALAAIYDADFDGHADATGERRLVEPPRDLIGHRLAAPLVTSIVELLTTAAPAEWPIEHDHIVLLNASVLLSERSQVDSAWKRYLKAVSARLRDRLVYPGIASWPQVSASAILRQIASQKLTAPSGGIISPSTVAIRPLTVFEATNLASRAHWVLLFVDRVVVGQVPRETVAIDDGEPETCRRDAVRFFRKKGIVVDDLVLHCGEDRLTIAGPTMGTFAGFFGPLLKALGFNAAELEVDDAA